MIKNFCTLAVICLLLSCNSDDTIQVNSQLVVEGWIDSEGFPVVLLTTTVPITENKESVSSLEDYIIKWAKVTISDGEEEVVLTGKIDKNYFPSYIYTTSRMRGVPGKTYKLTISYNEFYAEAETTIPEAVEVDSFVVKRLSDNSDFYGINAYFKDNPEEHNFYHFFVYTSSSEYKQFASARLSLTNDEVCNGQDLCVPIYRDRNVKQAEDYEQNFHHGEIVRIKLTQLTYDGFLFWKSYEETATLSRNPLFPVTSGLRSNIKGGLGYWLGYGSSKYTVEIK